MDKWREHFFQCFVAELRARNRAPLSVLELGSGPGFLAKRILEATPGTVITMLDFSPAMHELARERLGARPARPSGDCGFQGRGLERGARHIRCLVTHQAVHELRHKRHALTLHQTVRPLLRSHCYLVCDHHVGDDGMTNEAFYMTVGEQRRCLEEAGFTVIMPLEMRGLVLRGVAG
jgi:SAM-dependent methyltransferase